MKFFGVVFFCFFVFFTKSCESVSSFEASPWRPIERASPDAQVKFSVALKQRNLLQFEQLFLEISNPKSSQYANYLNIDEVLDIIAPPAEDAELVINWLTNQCPGDIQISNLRDALRVQSSVACAEKMFEIELFRYQFEGEPHTVIRVGLDSPLPKFPSAFSAYVEFVEGLVRLPVVRRSMIKKKKQNSPIWINSTTESKTQPMFSISSSLPLFEGFTTCPKARSSKLQTRLTR